MKKYYICRDFDDNCGISKYGSSFYNSILLYRGYIYLPLSKDDNIDYLLKEIQNDDLVWFEIGLASSLELSFFKKLVKKGNTNLVVTIHDSPFLEYPILRSKYYFINIFYKLIQIVFLRKPFDHFFYKYLKFTKYIFTLNPKGKRLLEKRFGLKNIYSIKHILTDIGIPEEKNYSKPQILYFGFIGKNKGLEYALELHEKINLHDDNIFSMKVIGIGIDQKSNNYLDTLKKKYINNVEYLGYVNDEELDQLMKEDNVVFLPTKDYRFICPTSGSVLNSMKKLNIIFTNDVNSNSYIIKDSENGFFLTGNIQKDVLKVKELLSSEEKRRRIAKNIHADLTQNYSKNAIDLEISKYEI